jgi:NDP-sugar pyrophosphorylase family protein
MKAVLLAGGLGTRLAPLTDTVPKILVPVAGEPLLAHQLRYLAASGVREVAINIHHYADTVEDYLRTASTPLEIVIYREEVIRGTAGAIFPMKELLTERFIVLYGDVVTDADLRDLQRPSRGIATLGYYVSPEMRDKGILELDADGRVLSFVEKPVGDDGVGCINAGVYALDPAIFDFVPPTGDFGFDVWPTVLASDQAIYGHQIEGYILDVGSIDALGRLEQDIQNGVLTW